MSTAVESPPLAVAPAGRERLAYGDAIRVWGTVAVVIGHCCDMVLFNGGAMRNAPLDWWVCNLVDAACRWAVPAYIMLSGALLLDPHSRQTPADFYRRRLARIGVPLAFWTAFFMLLAVEYTGWRTARLEADGWRGSIWLDLVRGQPYPHLHFIIRIAGLYAFTPMFRVFLRHASPALAWGTVLALLGLSAGDSVVNGITGQQPSIFARFAPFVGYYLCGHLLRHYRPSPGLRRWCWMVVLASIAVLALWSGFCAPRLGLSPYPSMTFLLWDFLSPVRVLMALAAWVLLTDRFSRPWDPARPGHRLVTGYLAPATLGIYLIHPLFREILFIGKVYLPLLILPHPAWRTIDFGGVDVRWPVVWVGVALVPLLVYVPSALLTLLLMRIPFVRRIVG